MKHLVISTDCFMPRLDGIVRFLTEIVPTLKESYNITILAPEFPGEYKGISGARVIRFSLINIQFGDIHFSKFCYGKIKEIIKDADLVFNQSIGPIGICSILAARQLKKPVVCYVHSIDWELATRSIDRYKYAINTTTKIVTKFLYNKCDMLLVPSLESEEKLTGIGIRTPKKVIELGTDVEYFKPAKNKETAKQALGIGPHCVVIGYCGRIAREKNIITLYRAFRQLEKRHPHLKLLIVGKGVNALEEEFTSGRNIIMTGEKKDVVPYFQAMDIFVLPSLTETSSLATMEAMACAIPPVVTPVGYVKEYVKDKENGMTFPFQNVTVLSLKLEMLIKDKALRERLGKSARETIVKRFNWKRTIEKIKKTLAEYEE